MFIDVRCQHCQHLLCRVSRDFYGIVEVKCDKCKRLQKVSLSFILRQVPLPDVKPATIPR